MVTKSKLKRFLRKRKLRKNCKLKLKKKNQREKRESSSWKTVKNNLSNLLEIPKIMAMMMVLIIRWMRPTSMQWNGIRKKMPRLSQNKHPENHKKIKKNLRQQKNEFQLPLIKLKTKNKLMCLSLTRKKINKMKIKLKKLMSNQFNKNHNLKQMKLSKIKKLSHHPKSIKKCKILNQNKYSQNLFNQRQCSQNLFSQSNQYKMSKSNHNQLKPKIWMLKNNNRNNKLSPHKLKLLTLNKVPGKMVITHQRKTKLEIRCQKLTRRIPHSTSLLLLIKLLNQDAVYQKQTSIISIHIKIRITKTPFQTKPWTTQKLKQFLVKKALSQ